MSGLCLFILALSVYGFFLRPGDIDTVPRRIWNGFDVFLVDSAVPEGEVERRLALAGAGEVLSRNDVVLAYCEFPGLGKVSLDEAAERFDDADPRYDLYMRSVGNYFTSRDGRYSLYYCEENGTSPEEIAAEAFAGTSIEYRLLPRPGNGDAQAGLGRIVTSGVILLFGIFLGFLVRKYLSVITVTAIACAGVGFFSGLPVLPAALIFQFASVFFCRDFLTRYKRRLNEAAAGEEKSRKEPIFRLMLPPVLTKRAVEGGLLPLTALLAGIGITLGSGGSAAEAAAVLVMAAAAASVAMVRAGILAVAQTRREHRLFFSIPLRRQRITRGRYRDLAAAALAGMVILFGVRLLPPVRGTAFPVELASPEVPLPGGRLNSEDLKILPGEPPGPSQLPDLRHYLQHLSFQELYLNGGRSTLTTFAQSGGKIVKLPGEMSEPEEDWIRRRTEEFAATPLGKLLVPEEGPVSARYDAPAAAESEEAIPLFAVVVWLGVLLTGLYGTTPLTAGTLYGMKSIEPRRRRQAA